MLLGNPQQPAAFSTVTLAAELPEPSDQTKLLSVPGSYVQLSKLFHTSHGTLTNRRRSRLSVGSKIDINQVRIRDCVVDQNPTVEDNGVTSEAGRPSVPCGCGRAAGSGVKAAKSLPHRGSAELP
jgi:hypothetical protein